MYQVFKAKMDIQFDTRVMIPHYPLKVATSDGKNFEIHLSSKSASGKLITTEVMILSDRKRLMTDFELYLQLIHTVLNEQVGLLSGLKDVHDVSCVVLGDLVMVEDGDHLQLKKDQHNHFYVINKNSSVPIMNSFDDEDLARNEYSKYLQNYIIK